MGKIFWRERKRKDGTTSRSLYIKFYDPSKGYSVDEHIASGNQKDAERTLRAREKAKDDGEPIMAPKAKKVLMCELFELLRDNYKRNGKKDLYGVELNLKNHLIPYFKNYRAMAVTTEVASDFAKSKQDSGLKPATINRMLSHLSYSFRLGFQLGKVNRVPLIQRFKENNRRKGFFERADFLKVHAQLPRDVQGIAELGFIAGMREGEILGLLWEQVDIPRCIIRLEETKNGDAREIHYAENPEIKSLIDTQFEHKLETEARTGKKIEHLFFRFSTGKPIKDFRVAWKTASNKAGVKRLFHDLRRTAIRNLTLAGVPRETAKLISGHETDAVFERYNIRNPKDTRKALGKVSSLNISSAESSAGGDFSTKDRIQ